MANITCLACWKWTKSQLSASSWATRNARWIQDEQSIITFIKRAVLQAHMRVLGKPIQHWTWHWTGREVYHTEDSIVNDVKAEKLPPEQCPKTPFFWDVGLPLVLSCTKHPKHKQTILRQSWRNQKLICNLLNIINL